MPSLTIHNVEPEAAGQLRRRAVAHGRSMQDEARTIQRGALADAAPSNEVDLYTDVRSLVEPIGGIDDLDISMRDVGRNRPTFD